MKTSWIKMLVIAGSLSLLVGCSADRAQLVSQPSAAKPGDTIPVVLSDVYVVVSTTATTSAAYKRDSLHVVYGLPAGWSVVSSDYYVANGLRLNQIAGIAADSALLLTLLQDSLAAYTSRESAMAADPTWKSFFVHKTLKAHGFSMDSIQVAVDSVGQWVSYGAKININIPAGTAMDTSFPVSSLPIDTSTLTSSEKFLFGSVKTIWVKTVPIVCFARIAVGQVQSTFNLYYFSKTDSLPSTAKSILPNYDIGDMAYAAININSNNPVLLQPSSRTQHSLLTVGAGPAATTVIKVGSLDGGRISICNAAGKTIRLFQAGAGQSGPIVWDHTTSSGEAVGTGTYVIRLESAGRVLSQAIRIVK
jgi:hypothetical protein